MRSIRMRRWSWKRRAESWVLPVEALRVNSRRRMLAIAALLVGVGLVVLAVQARRSEARLVTPGEAARTVQEVNADEATLESPSQSQALALAATGDDPQRTRLEAQELEL